MKVYLLEDFIPYEDTFIEGIFSSEEKAEEAAENIKFHGKKSITEYELDTPIT
jgi:hypothetical protein